MLSYEKSMSHFLCLQYSEMVLNKCLLSGTYLPEGRAGLWVVQAEKIGT